MRRFFALALCLALLFGPVPAALAQQGAASAQLYAADTSAFPKISTLLDVFDAQRFFASGLKPGAVSIIEDETQLPVDSLTETAVPLQLVVAVNQGKALDTRNSSKISRFERTAQVLIQWAQGRPADLPDDISLVSQAGAVLNHGGAADFAASLGAFQPDLRTSIPNLQSLSIAMDTVSAQTPQPGMKRAILFITPQTADINLAASLAPFIQRAQAGSIRIFVWYVDSTTNFATTSAAAFNDLAIQTGGTMFQFSGDERFPDPESYFSPLRRTYQLTYTSRAASSGEHKVRAQITLPAAQAVTPDQTFSIELQPPNPIPVTPAGQITRQAPADDPFNTSKLLPTSQALDIIIEFPDGHPRPLVRTTLYVDGIVAGQNTAEPFDQFTWDISAYTQSGEHEVKVEAVDVLGLSRTSMPVPVVVTVVQPPRGPTALLARFRTQITYGSILLAGLVLLLILARGRLPGLLSARQRRAQADPLTQSVESLGVPAAAPVEKKKNFHLFARRIPAAPRAKKENRSAREVEHAASFLRVNAEGQAIASSPVLVTGPELVIGTDPVQCSQVLDDPTVSPVHARLRRTDDGGFLLLDNNSTAGTWVNFEPVPREGCRLAHGDMVNFGQLTYRFTLRVPPAANSPKIRPIEE